jgi:inner membrane transporter RhtA
MVSILPATATIVGVVVLSQVPTWIEVAGVALVISAVALHREPSHDVLRNAQGVDVPSRP